METLYEKETEAFDFSIKAREEELEEDMKDTKKALEQTNNLKDTLAEVEENPIIIKKLETNLKSLLNQLDEHDEIIAGLQEERDKLDEELLAAQKEAGEARTDLKDYEDEQLANFEMRIIEYSKEFDDAKARTDKYDKDLMNADSEYQTITSDADKEAAAEYQKIKQARVDLADSKKELSSLIEKKELHQSTMEKHDKNSKDLETELKKINQNMVDIEQLISTVSEEEDKASLETQMSGLKEQSDIKTKELDMERKTVSKLQSELEGIETTINQTLEKIKTYEETASLELVEPTKEELKEREVELAKYKMRIVFGQIDATSEMMLAARKEIQVYDALDTALELESDEIKAKI